MARLFAAAVALAVVLAPIASPIASADGDGNNQSTTVLCRDADYADVHPMLCDGVFGPVHGGHGGGNGGLLGGIIRAIGGLL